MDAPRTARRWARHFRVGVLLACLGIIAVVTSLASAARTDAALSAMAAVDAATASPSSFVPDWDGHTDVTVLTYRLVRRSNVTIRVLDARGRVVTSHQVGMRDAGVHEATWDGRRSDGSVLSPGRYALRVDARPVAAAATPSDSDAPGSADMGGGRPVVPGARATVVTLRSPGVALTSVQLSRTAIGRAKASLNAGARYRLSSNASVSAAIVDSRGRVVRTLASGPARAGTNAVAWNGRTADGSWAPDGEYALVVSATGGARPTTTNRLPINVDRRVPTLRTSSSGRANVVAGGTVRIPLSVQASEAGTLVARVGRRTQQLTIRPGASRISLDGSRLGLVARPFARSVVVTLQLRDGADNVRARRVRVTIPRRAAVTNLPPSNPSPTDPGPVVPPPAGKWPWPVDGIVTSEFGLRDGRPHEGIDIAIATGTPIHPVARGTVAFVGAYGGYGNLVIVDHGGGMTTRYAHMSRFGAFAVGAQVSPEDVIGLVGCTGSCTGPHVHFETRVADAARNPRAFLVAR